MRTLKLITFAVTLVFLSSSLYAQEASINASVDKRILNSNEELTLTIEIQVSSGRAPEPKIPELEDFEVTGRYTSSSQSMIFANGRLERTISKTYTLTLFPLKTGKLTIPRIQMRHRGEIYKTSPIQIEVLPSQAPMPKRAEPEEPTETYDYGNVREAFLKGKVDKKEVYVGEQFLYTLSLYRLTNLPLQGQFSSLPQFEGFRKTDLEPVDKRIFLNGRAYDVREWTFSLIPVSSGEYTIEEAVLPCQVDDFSFSFFYRSRRRRYRLTSEPITVKVLPLPEAGKPPDFSGAVGNFTISSYVDKNKLKVNEALSLKIEIAGRGDLSSAKDPVFPALPEFSIYESKNELKSNISGKTFHTLKTYEYVLVPEKAGKYILEPIRFAYFDTSKKRYRTIKTEPISLIIAPGKKKTSEGKPFFAGKALSKKSITLKNKDIRFIKPDVEILKDYTINPKDPIILAINILPLLLLVGGIVYKKRATKLKMDVGYARSLRAEKHAKKRLKESSKYIQNDSENRFPTLITNAITEFIADKLNISAKGLTINDIETRLEDLSLPKEIIAKITDTINECDFFRFSSTSSKKEEREKIYNDAKEIMIELERLFLKMAKKNNKR